MMLEKFLHHHMLGKKLWSPEVWGKIILSQTRSPINNNSQFIVTTNKVFIWLCLCSVHLVYHFNKYFGNYLIYYRAVWSTRVRNKQQTNTPSTGEKLERWESVFDQLWLIWDCKYIIIVKKSMLFLYYFELFFPGIFFLNFRILYYCSQIAVTEDQKIFNWGRSPHFFRFYMVSIVLFPIRKSMPSVPSKNSVSQLPPPPPTSPQKSFSLKTILLYGAECSKPVTSRQGCQKDFK